MELVEQAKTVPNIEDFLSKCEKEYLKANLSFYETFLDAITREVGGNFGMVVAKFGASVYQATKAAGPKPSWQANLFLLSELIKARQEAGQLEKENNEEESLKAFWKDLAKIITKVLIAKNLLTEKGLFIGEKWHIRVIYKALKDKGYFHHIKGREKAFATFWNKNFKGKTISNYGLNYKPTTTEKETLEKIEIRNFKDIIPHPKT